MNNLIKLGIPQLIRDLENGMTRYKHEDAGWGSIQEKYGMTTKEVEIIFRHPKIKDIQPTRMRFILVDEDVDPTVNTILFSEEPTPNTTMDQFNKLSVNQAGLVEEVPSQNVEVASFLELL